MPNNVNDPFAAHLVGLWDFLNTGPTEDTGLADGIAQNGHLDGDAAISGGRLHLDGHGDRFEVDGGNDAPFNLVEGTISVQFTQNQHVGTSPDSIVNRGEQADWNQEGWFEISVTEDGAVQVQHCDNGVESFLTTGSGFFNEGDTIKATYSWSETDGVTFHVENLTQITEATVSAETTGLTMDVTDNDDESWTFGARETDDGTYSKYFDGSIDYVAVYNTDFLNNAGDGIVSGDETANEIDLNYMGDPEGDMIDNGDALLPGEAPNDDIVDAGAGDDTIEAGLGDDDVYAGSGDDSVIGESGNDLIYGDSNLPGGPIESSVEREVLKWSEAGVGDGSEFSNFSQDTGNVTVDVSFTKADSDLDIEFSTDTINTDGVDTGDLGPINSSSSVEIESNRYSEDGAISLAFSDAVENVSFRVADLDFDASFSVFAFDAHGSEIPVTFVNAGSNIDLEDEDNDGNIETVEDDDPSDGNSRDSEKNSVGVEIAGPVSSIIISYDAEGSDNSKSYISDIYFDAPADADTGNDGNDTLSGGEGEDTILGEGGDDVIIGGDGPDSLSGGDDADTFVGGTNFDRIDGGSGGDDNDTLDLRGMGDVSVVYDPEDGEKGVAVIYNTGDVIEFEEIENVLFDSSPSGSDGIVEGSAENDLIDFVYNGDPDGDFVDAGDNIFPPLGPDDDIIVAFGGDDEVVAGEGNDIVFAGEGDDIVGGG